MSTEQTPVKTPHDELVARFLTFACWDHHEHGKADHRMYDRAAQKMLAHHPELQRDSLYTAIVCGHLEEVQRLLDAEPELINKPGGAREWSPILYLCYTRFSNKQTIDNAAAMARLLLERGADPNAFYMAGDAVYSALVGVAGEGEQDSPRQPQAKALFQILLEHGANPFDIQVLYNTHFSGEVLWWLELIYEHSLKTGRIAEWKDPNWMMLDMGGYGSGAQFLLTLAQKKNDLVLAEWCLTRGARAVPQPLPYHPKHRAKGADMDSIRRQAVFMQQTEMAALLERCGAQSTPPVFEGEEAFAFACFNMNLDEVKKQIEQHPEYLQSATVLLAAAQRNRADVVALLLDLGGPIEIEQQGHRALHEAAGNKAIDVAKLLIERGAEVDPLDPIWKSAPLGWAAHADDQQMLDFLSRYSRFVWTLSFRGYVDRLREVVEENPDLAKSADSEGYTLLWWLPDDESKAIEIVKLLIAHGANPAAKSKAGTTAASWARKREMLEVVKLLE
ncbi:MAG TPA: ankyrin repeat domain-containing protein [Pyrinomonadaceae bacterium]|nr:ankyrin repeat domain-containing protein [Pyrinomonadaceae bacterium]